MHIDHPSAAALHGSVLAHCSSIGSTYALALNCINSASCNNITRAAAAPPHVNSEVPAPSPTRSCSRPIFNSGTSSTWPQFGRRPPHSLAADLAATRAICCADSGAPHSSDLQRPTSSSIGLRRCQLGPGRRLPICFNSAAAPDLLATRRPVDLLCAAVPRPPSARDCT